MMKLKTEWSRMLALLRGPGTYFDNILREREDRLFRDALSMLTVLLLVSTLLYVLFTVLNLTELKQQAQAMRNYGPPNALPAWLQDGLPWNRFLFPVFWFILIFYGGAMRHVLILLLGEPNASLARTQAIGIYASVPFIVISIPGFALGALFPYVPGPGAPVGNAGFAGVISTLLLVVGLAWHAIVVMKGLRRFYNQNAGRAFLTWAFAPFAGTFLCCGAWIVFYFVQTLAAG